MEQSKRLPRGGFSLSDPPIPQKRRKALAKALARMIKNIDTARPDAVISGARVSEVLTQRLNTKTTNTILN